MKFSKLVEFAAQIKQYAVYGVGLLYPLFSLITFLGVIKLAFGIPPELAAVIAFVGVMIVGIMSFKSGLYSQDMDITWKNTPMAKDLCERTRRIEEQLQELTKK